MQDRSFICFANRFGPFYSVIYGEGQWNELCDGTDNATSTCPPQEVHFQSIFTTSFLFLSIGNAVFGFSLDIIGPRFTAIVGAVVSTIHSTNHLPLLFTDVRDKDCHYWKRISYICWLKSRYWKVNIVGLYTYWLWWYWYLSWRHATWTAFP